MNRFVQSEIPEIFYSSKTKKAFKHCIMCEKSLLKNNTYYMIEKAFSQNVISGAKQIIFEYAICLDCHEKIAKDLSEESLKNLKMYFDLYVNFEERDASLLDKEDEVVIDNWISECIISKKPVAKMTEFQIAGAFYEDKIMYGSLPFAIGGAIADEMQELLSKKTKETLDGLKDLIYPPEIWDKIPEDKLIFV